MAGKERDIGQRSAPCAWGELEEPRVGVFLAIFRVASRGREGWSGSRRGTHQMFASLVVPRPRDMVVFCSDPNARVSAPFCSDDGRGLDANFPNPVLAASLALGLGQVFIQNSVPRAHFDRRRSTRTPDRQPCRGRSRRHTGVRRARGSSRPKMWSARTRGTAPASTLTDVTRLTMGATPR